MLFDSANLAYWILLGIGFLLFLLMIASGAGEDDLDLGIDFDLDIEADFNPLYLLGWLGFGSAPFILLLAIDLCVWGLTGWMLNFVIGSITGTIPVNFLGLGGGIFLISLIFSLAIGKFISRPIGQLFASFGEDASSDRIIGCIGTVTSPKLPYLTEGKIGQVDVTDAANNLVTASVALPDWARVIPHRGQQVIIIEQQEKCFMAIAKDSSDEDRWLKTTEKN